MVKKCLLGASRFGEDSCFQGLMSQGLRLQGSGAPGLFKDVSGASGLCAEHGTPWRRVFKSYHFKLSDPRTLKAS